MKDDDFSTFSVRRLTTLVSLFLINRTADQNIERSVRWNRSSVKRPPIRLVSSAAIGTVVSLLTACIPPARLPAPPLNPPGLLPVTEPGAKLAMQLAPTLFVQRDEPFPLIRVAAVVHPRRPIIAYHLLWEHDVNLQWVPWAQPSDEEVVWVGYDSLTGTATDLWTYWHGTILHADWRAAGNPAIDVQWGKHGSLPHRVAEGDLPRSKTLNVFYLGEFLMLPDIWMGKLAHGGPWGFFHGYGRYREFTDMRLLSDRLDAIIRSDEPREALRAVFGPKYSNKIHWPWDVTSPGPSPSLQ